MTKRAAPRDMLTLTNLGAGNEVGRSCHIIQFKDKTVMLDAGVHPAFTGQASLPYYDEFDLSEVDILLISHFHLDHAASLPHVMQKTNFRGRVFMTHPTKAIYRWLMSDFVRVSSAGAAANDVDQLYSEAELSKSFEAIEAIDYHSTQVVNGIKFTAYHAGHVLGGAMYMIEIAGVKILFTGDYSREEDRHLNVAEVPPEKPDILITESTYGTATHQPRLEKEARFINLITKTIARGGRVLLPVFALGRAQELLLILEEYWARHPEIQHVPVYYISSLAKKCMAVYQTYIHTMAPAIQTEFQHRNPFVFKHVASLRSLDRFDDIGPSVMLASPGMLQNGNSRTLLERWAPDERNLLFVTGYSVEGTMAKLIMNEPTEIQSLATGQKVPRRMAVEELSFAAHVDFQQNRDFIDQVDATHIVLVHGEQTNMGKLKSALLSKYASLRGTEREKHIWNPRNCDPLELEFDAIKLAKVVGSLARALVHPPAAFSNGGSGVDSVPRSLQAVKPREGAILEGIVVQRDFELKLLAPADLQEESRIGTTIVRQRHTLRLSATPSLVEWHLRQVFGAATGRRGGVHRLEAATADDKHIVEFDILNSVRVALDTKKGRATVAWRGGRVDDTLADAAVAVLSKCESAPQSVKMAQRPCSHVHGSARKAADGKLVRPGVDTRAARIQTALQLLKSQFGEDNVTVAHDADVRANGESNGHAIKAEPADNADADAASVAEVPNGCKIQVDDHTATVAFDTLRVDCAFRPMKDRIQGILRLLIDAIAPFEAAGQSGVDEEDGEMPLAAAEADIQIAA